MNFARGKISPGERAPEKNIYSVPAQETAKHRTNCKDWLASGERRRSSNEANTRNPLKLAGVPKTPELISAARAEVRHIVETSGGDIAV